MNIREMQLAFGQQLNQFGEALQLHSSDIEYWLNKAQLELVKEKYNGRNLQGKGFEQSQQKIDDLRVLLVKDKAVETVFSEESMSPTGFYIDSATIPNNNLFLISHRSSIHYKYPSISYEVVDGRRIPEEANTKVVFNRFSQSDDIYKLLQDPFNKTKISSPLVDINEDKINVYTDETFVVDKVIFNYLRLPIQMNIKEDVSSELSEHLHDEIIQRGADLFLQNTRELKQRLQRETPVSNQEQTEQTEQ